jgi:hypothetical protein
MHTQTPIFTTSKPGFMASTEDRNQEFIDQHTHPRTLNDKAKGISIYFHGELEHILGFDIPIWLSGTISGHSETVYVWNVEGTIMYRAYLTWDHHSKIGRAGYIQLPLGVTHAKPRTD